MYSSGHIYTIQTVSGSEVTVSGEPMAFTEINEDALNEMLVDKCGDIQSYGEFVTALRSENANPGFIDLGLIDDLIGRTLDKFAFEITFRVDDFSDNCAIFGSRNEPSIGNYSIATGPVMDSGQQPGNHVVAINHNYAESSGKWNIPIIAGEKNIVRIDGYKVVFNGQEYPKDLNLSCFYGRKSLYLFAVNSGYAGNETIALNGMNKAIYDFKIYLIDDGVETLSHHYRPYVNNKGVPCMLDVVTNKEYPATLGTLVPENE
jgi:hypothetical protein